jgi:hypothetical protein
MCLHNNATAVTIQAEQTPPFFPWPAYDRLFRRRKEMRRLAFTAFGVVVPALHLENSGVNVARSQAVHIPPSCQWVESDGYRFGQHPPSCNGLDRLVDDDVVGSCGINPDTGALYPAVVRVLDLMRNSKNTTSGKEPSEPSISETGKAHAGLEGQRSRDLQKSSQAANWRCQVTQTTEGKRLPPPDRHSDVRPGDLQQSWSWSGSGSTEHAVPWNPMGAHRGPFPLTWM